LQAIPNWEQSGLKLWDPTVLEHQLVRVGDPNLEFNYLAALKSLGKNVGPLNSTALSVKISLD